MIDREGERGSVEGVNAWGEQADQRFVRYTSKCLSRFVYTTRLMGTDPANFCSTAFRASCFTGRTSAEGLAVRGGQDEIY